MEGYPLLTLILLVTHFRQNVLSEINWIYLENGEKAGVKMTEKERERWRNETEREKSQKSYFKSEVEN